MMGDNSAPENQVLVSETFHSNFGDFALQSSDGPLFYFPKTILQYSSKVFATMFEVGTASSQDKPILIQANSRTLELLLKLLHPALINPRVDKVNVLADLLRLVNQYDMEPTIHILQAYFTLPFTPNSTDSLITKEPLASLIVSYSYGYREIARAALKEVIKCNWRLQIEMAEGYDIPLVLLRHIYTKREELIAEHVGSINALGTRAIQAAGFADFAPEDLAGIQERATLEVTNQPSFSSVRAAYKAFLEVGVVDNISYRLALDEWEADALEKESQLPEL